MRKVVLYSLLSLDGVAEDPGNYVFDFDDEMRANLQHVVGSQDAVVLGRRTYDEWAPYWPTSDEEPFAGFINGVHKYVATSRPPADPWANSTVVEGLVADRVRELKGRSGGDIGVHGSITLARSLIQDGLLDELRLVITPVVAGSGRRLFDQDVDTRRLQLLEARSTPSGTLLAHYRVDG